MTERCENCRHVGKVYDARGDAATTCQRYPPVIIDAVIARNVNVKHPVFSATDLRVASVWPATSPKACCGEWASDMQPKPPRRPFRAILRERQGGTP